MRVLLEAGNQMRRVRNRSGGAAKLYTLHID